ncbi:MAG: DUF2800 domain-containing protein [Bacillota bacterium]
MTAHAILSASGAHRWLACPASARLEQEFPDSTSTYAEEGTLAHALAELELRHFLGGLTWEDYESILEPIASNPLYSGEMYDYVQQHVDLVIERINAARAATPDALVFLEQRLDFSRWVPDGFGTGDVVIIADGTLEVIDLKYGKGVPVSAEGNPQIRLYGLGALDSFGTLYEIDRVRMTIVQPRLDSISTEEMSVEDLVTWGDTVVLPAAMLAYSGEGPYAAGEHCQFCRAKAQCRARAEANLELAKYDFRAPALLTHEEIAEILSRAEELQKWAADLQAYALDQAVNHGVRFPGWKLVEGRSNRKYEDEAQVTAALLAEGYTEEQIYEKKLLGISAMEKLLTKKRFETILGGLVVKPEGKPVLVPESDKRPEINSVASAQADFR